MTNEIQQCFFGFKFGCEEKQEKLVNCGIGRINNIIKCSKIYGDDKYKELDKHLEGDNKGSILSHKSCVSTYTSPEKVKRFLKSVEKSEGDARPLKRTRLACDEEFSFESQCLFCAEECVVDKKKDSKHPDRWKPSLLCRETVNSVTNES